MGTTQRIILNEVTYMEKHCRFFSFLNVTFETFDKHVLLGIPTGVLNLVKGYSGELSRDRNQNTMV